MKFKHTLAIDIETYSPVDLKSAGMYAYAQAPGFEILLLAYAWDNGPVNVVDLTGEAGRPAPSLIPGEPMNALTKLPLAVQAGLTDPGILKTAFNAAFERTCLAAYYGVPMPPEQWECTMVRAAEAGLPRSLKGAGLALGLPQDKQKDRAGGQLIRYFCVPCKPTKANGGRTRNRPRDNRDAWRQFIEYNRQDVEAERAIRAQLPPILPSEQELWVLDQKINDRGVRIDRRLVDEMVDLDDTRREALMQRAREITGLENPNSREQLLRWINERSAQQFATLRAEDLPVIAKSVSDPQVRDVIQIRQQLGKTSTQKYKAMQTAACQDGRVRGLTAFYGAPRTGRWCLTGDHEVLTRNGWVRLDEWSGGEIICWSPQSAVFAFQKAARLSFPYSGELIAIDDKRVQQLGTPEHTMACLSKNGTWEKRTLDEMLRRGRTEVAFTGQRLGMETHQAYPLRALIMTQADGHYAETGALRFHFRKERKIERCKMLLRKCEIPFSTHNNEDGTTTITIPQRHLPLWLREFHNKTFGYWMLDESADIILDEIEYWDAYRAAPNSIQYTTTNETNADVIQAVATLSGRCARKHKKSRKNKNWKDAFIVDIWETPGRSHAVRRESYSKVSFKGPVYCAETKTGYFLVRRNGSVWITGNSGRLVQLQNLPRNYLDDLDSPRDLVRDGQGDALELLYASPADVMSQLIRTALIPKPGCRFIVSDFSAIEARVLAWLAEEEWRLEVFRAGGKIYEESASKMFGVPVEKIAKGNPEYALRQKGKVAELALGYQGAAGALMKMGALKMGLTEEELPGLVQQWRAANQRIVTFWNTIEWSATQALTLMPGSQHYVPVGKLGVRIYHDKTAMRIQLPSGRSLCYQHARIETREKWGYPTDGIVYNATADETGSAVATYGGKLTENLIQAVARDCLAEAIRRVERRGLQVVFHVHDEIICEVPSGESSAEEVAAIMSQPIDWAPGLPLAADAYECDYYRKD